jgi:hypothetical protein
LRVGFCIALAYSVRRWSVLVLAFGGALDILAQSKCSWTIAHVFSLYYSLDVQRGWQLRTMIFMGDTLSRLLPRDASEPGLLA